MAEPVSSLPTSKSSAEHLAIAVMDDVSTGDPDGGRHALRRTIVHMIEEYARHCGHADLLREVIDGSTGD